MTISLFELKTQSEFDALVSANKLICGAGYLVGNLFLAVPLTGNTYLSFGTTGGVPNHKTFIAYEGQYEFTMPPNIPMVSHLVIINDVIFTSNTSRIGQVITTQPQKENAVVTIINLI